MRNVWNFQITQLATDGSTLTAGQPVVTFDGNELQRRLVETQQSMERDYLRLRHIEARYRVLFDTSSEAVLMVDAATQRVLEANVGAQTLLKDAGKRLVAQAQVGQPHEEAEGREVREPVPMDGQRAELQGALLEFAQPRIDGDDLLLQFGAAGLVDRHQADIEFADLTFCLRDPGDEIADRAAARVIETGRMLQLDPMSPLERRWIHLALRGNDQVTTQSIGEEPNRRIVVVPRA